MPPETSKLNLQHVLGQMGVGLNGQKPPSSIPKDEAFDGGTESSMYSTTTHSAAVVEHESDSLPTEKKPFVKILFILGILLPTLGLTIAVMLWGAGEMQQQAKKPDTLKEAPKAEVTSAQEKEIADLKASIAMQQQKVDAAKAIAPTTTTNPTTTGTTPATFPAKDGSVPATPTPTAAPSTPVINTVPTATDTAQLNNTQRQLRQAQLELNTVKQAQAQEDTKLAASRRAFQQETAQLNNTRQLRQVAPAPVPRAPTQIATRSAFTPVASNPRLVTQPRAYQQQSPFQPTGNYSKPPQPTWDEAAALSIYGGQEVSSNPIAAAVAPAAPQIAQAKNRSNQAVLRLPAGAVVSGRLLTPFYTLIAANSQLGSQLEQALKNNATVVIDRAIQVGSGWNLPAGTTIEFELSVADNGMVQSISKKVIYNNSEIDIPTGAFTLTGTDNRPLMAKIENVNSDALRSANTNNAIFSTLSEVGKALIQGSTSSTVTIGNGATIAQSNNSNPNILGAVLSGFSNSILQGNADNAKALAANLEKQSKVAYLSPGTQLNVYVAQGVTFNLP
ncbi:hypothetical protein [Chamaesiphon sp.]|uniref:hypothetical protein n=1 Tax=Chamaesiphon sp. TaxID=2814140 RepID=UPI003593972E